MERRWKLGLQYLYLQHNKRPSAVRFVVTTIKGLSIIVLLLALQTSSSWASSEVAPFWLYETADGFFMAKMSSKAEQDDYDGVTSGAVKSKLFIYKIFNSKIQKNPTFVTTSICESYRDRPERLRCVGTSGPFSGASYKSFSTYGVDKPKGNVRLELSDGQDNQEVRKRLIVLLKEYVRTKEFKESNGFFSFLTFTCSAGCRTKDTPTFMVEVNLLGD